MAMDNVMKQFDEYVVIYFPSASPVLTKKLKELASNLDKLSADGFNFVSMNDKIILMSRKTRQGMKGLKQK